MRTQTSESLLALLQPKHCYFTYLEQLLRAEYIISLVQFLNVLHMYVVAEVTL